MRVLITGSRGFIGKNLAVRLSELGGYEVIGFDRDDSPGELDERVKGADAIIHLAGVNRPHDAVEFSRGNVELTRRLCDCIGASGRNIPLLVASSIQATNSTPYGESKRLAEQAATELADRTGNSTIIYRLANVFGKWCRPNYNSVVATFCHNIAHDLPIEINDASAPLRLVYVDDVVGEFIKALDKPPVGLHRREIDPVYEISVGELARQIRAFRECRDSLLAGRVGTGLTRALYASYVSNLPPAKFAYDLPHYDDERGIFVEVLKTADSGQFSFFTAKPGVTRGGHYHHSKTEKFLVIKGSARFGFRQIITNEVHTIFTSGEKPQIVETVPGWAHDITNIGVDEMIVMLWANEIFDRSNPDTIVCKV